MANPIKTNSITGAYILEDETGWVAANTPGNANLDNLTEGTQYLYFDTVRKLDYVLTANRDSEIKIGFTTTSLGDGKKSWYSHTYENCNLFLIALVTSDVAGKCRRFLKTLNRAGTSQKYFVKQKASEVFELYPNAAAVLKKYTRVIVRGIQTIEVDDKGPDAQLAIVGMEEVWDA